MGYIKESKKSTANALWRTLWKVGCNFINHPPVFKNKKAQLISGNNKI
jgi:hypothetical protein